MLGAARAGPQSLLATLCGACMHREWHTELVCRLSEALHFIVKPRYPRWIVTEAHVTASVHGFYPVSAKCMFHAHQLPNLRRGVSNLRQPQVAAAWKHPL